MRDSEDNKKTILFRGFISVLCINQFAYSTNKNTLKGFLFWFCNKINFDRKMRLSLCYLSVSYRRIAMKNLLPRWPAPGGVGLQQLLALWSHTIKTTIQCRLTLINSHVASWFKFLGGHEQKAEGDLWKSLKEKFWKCPT